MTTRKRNHSSNSPSTPSRRRKAAGKSRGASRSSMSSADRLARRGALVEKLEDRRLLAGPQLIGIQPNEGELIVDGTVRDTAPRSLTFRFDQDQSIDPTTLDGIQIRRAGSDGVFDTADDVAIQPGSVTLGENSSNEVVVRFAETLVDDQYRIDVFGFDDAPRGIVGIRNDAGEFLQARNGVDASERVEFELQLGVQIEAIVPQPVVRLDSGELEQRRNEILVYFNEDELFVENDPATGLPTDRSAENPRFYQLLLTQESVRTTDDVLYLPERVIYDAPTNTARLIFQGDDINTMPGVPLGGGTFRLRIGTAVDSPTDLIVEPSPIAVAPTATTNLGLASDLAVQFDAKIFSEAGGGRAVRFVDTGAGGLTVALDPDSSDVIFDLGGTTPQVQDLQTVVQGTPAVNAVIAVSFSQGGVAGAGGTLVLPASIVDFAPVQLVAAGDTLSTATDVGVFGMAGQQLSSLLIRESITPQSYGIQLPGSPNDPGREALADAINDLFGADVQDGITEISYNFDGVISGGDGTTAPAKLNNITDVQKRRVREALELWSKYLGVQFRETVDEGITFAVGERSALLSAAGTQLRSVDELDAALRIDPTFDNAALVMSSQVNYGLDYGEDFFRKTMAGIGFLLGLDQNHEVTAQTLMALDPTFLNATIDPDLLMHPEDPFFGTQTTQQQTINPNIDAQTIDDPIPNALDGPEPVFPGNQDILHGQYLHRPESIDVDLYRFEVDLPQGREFGTLTAETFAERLADSSMLDTTLALYQEVSASASSDFGLGTSVSVDIQSQLSGSAGNRSRIEFLRTDRATGDTAVRVTQIIGDDGNPLPNAVRVDIPRLNAEITEVTVGQVVDAINNDEFASTLFVVDADVLSRQADMGNVELAQFAPITLGGGGTVELAQNDDYFSEDSFLTAELGSGVYYLGVTASGNGDYNPNLSGSGSGGTTQGDYEVLLKFEPQVSQSDVIRDTDGTRSGVPGTAIDGDLDGTPGGVNNFWFQTRPLERILQVQSTGAGIVPGQTMTISGSTGVSRRFEFVPVGGTAQPGNVPILYNATVGGTGTSTSGLALAIRTAINSVSGQTGVSSSLSTSGNELVLSGERVLSFSNSFTGVEALGRNIFVDKVSSVVADGTLAQPFNNVDNPFEDGAFDAALPGDIVRIVGNGGQDGDLSTTADNFSYQFGLSEIGGNVLPDGRHMDVPKGVTTMVDAGAVFKLRAAAVSVGSNSLLSDRSGGALQVLGAPRLVNLADPAISGVEVTDTGITQIGDSGSVVFTSTRDRSVDAASSGNSPAPAAGNWGGLIFQNDFDAAEGRANLESEGIFLQTVNHAELRYGGGSNIVINSVQKTVNPIQIVDLRPTITFNELLHNASAAMSATPNSFLETSFQSPRFQQAGAFTADYDRVGPDIKMNLVTDNSINGLFIRTESEANQPPREITVSARFDDVGIVHYIAENILIAGQPGGSIQDGFAPDFGSVTTQTAGGGSLVNGTYQYRMTFVDAAGFESLASDASDAVTISGGNRTAQLLNLPVIPERSDYLSRRLYRLNPLSGEYELVAQLNRSDATFTDNGSVATGGATLDLSRAGIRGRLDGSLVVDPNMVVKFRGARIELDHDTQLIAEGTEGKPVIFTSALDDRFGAGGSFDTNNDAGIAGGPTAPQRGDWSGLYAGPSANVSLDYATIAYGGGVSLIEGGQSRGFAALELQQADARVTNSRFEYNDNAMDGSGPIGRNGRLAITPATIFVRGSQPIIVGNEFVDNYGSIIDIDLASMTDELLTDIGRQTGSPDRVVGLDDNHGPLVRQNTTESTAGDVLGLRQLNGLRIRGGDLTSGSVWDDTDIVHVLYDSVVVGNQVSGGALELRSRPDESLVVKMLGQGTPNSATAGTGITATGSTGDINDRIGGTVHVIGLPGAPVVLTSLNDDTVGAGRKIDGSAQNDTGGDGYGSRPSSNDWRSLLFDNLSNDRNVAVTTELELPTAAPPGVNDTTINAQNLGDLAANIYAGDDQSRLGFDVQGFISTPSDVDTYAFTGVGGAEVWIDIDKTSIGLDTVIEIVDNSGQVLARSDNGYTEFFDPSLIENNGTGVGGDLLAGPLGDVDNPQANLQADGNYYDFGSTNVRDAGLRLTLPGNTGTRSNYFVRVRSASVDAEDIGGGQTSGSYRMQIRLSEAQEFAGSVVRHADIRYANHGIHVQALPGSSPLLGDAQENESADPFSPEFSSVFNTAQPGGYFIDGEPQYPTDIYASNDDLNGGFFSNDFFPVLNARPQNLGDLIDSKDGAISVGGSLSTSNDVDFYQIDVGRDASLSDVSRSTVFDIDYADGYDRPNTNLSVFFSPTGNPNDAELVLFGESSSILDDLSSPLDSELVGELLDRGSRTEEDAFIGPINLAQGSYFIAVTEAGAVPTELNSNSRLRRVPIESTVRIFDDAVEVIGGVDGQTPVNGGFVDTVSGGWSVTTDRSTDVGHQRVDSNIEASGTFGQTFAAIDTTSNQYDESDIGQIDFGSDSEQDVAYSFEHELIIGFGENVTQTRRDQILSQNNLTVLKSFDFINAVHVQSAETGDGLGQVIASLEEVPEVEYAERNVARTIALTPDDPQYSQMWHLNNVGQTGGTPDADIDLPEAWDTFTGSDQTVIAIIDSGVDLTHPDLVDNLWVNPGEIAGDGIDNDGNGYIDDINGIDAFAGDTDPQDAQGHGTHVAGTTAAVGNNATGVTGINWNSKIMALRVGDVGLSTAAIIESLDYLVTMKTQFGINIVVSNNSYGGSFASAAEMAAIQANIDAGIGFVAAAGNDSTNNDFTPQFPASYPIEEIITVASTDHNDQLSTFSNFGAFSVDVAAPGTNVLSTTLGGGYGLNSGTSMASPHVAGVYALLAGQDPTASVDQYRTAILLGADPLANLTGTSVTGARLNANGAQDALAILTARSIDNESMFFDRSVVNGSLRSTAFDLTGYSAGDLPRFYFDYFVDAADGDTITVQATSNEQTTPIELDVDLNNVVNFGAWRQGIASLDAFAGHTDVVIEFLYNADTADTSAEGLYLDNFIVGFAERGEMVSGATPGQGNFTASFGAVSGQYQLEVRPGNEYSQQLDGGLLIERGLKDNPKLSVPYYLSVPSGPEVVPYDTFSFEVYDSVADADVTLTFQYQPTEATRQNPSLVDPNAIAVPYSVNAPQDAGLIVASVTNSVITAIQGVADVAILGVRRVDSQPTQSFDTNDRQTEAITLVAPAGSQLSDGDQFTLSDGSNTVVFEFTTDSAVAFGSIGIRFTPADTPTDIAEAIIRAINSGVVQGELQLRASTSTGDWDFSNPTAPDALPTDGRVALHGHAVGQFVAVENVGDATSSDPLPVAGDGTVQLSAIYHHGLGDQNAQRLQGAFIIENNTVTEAHAIGIWSDTGHRGTDPEDNRDPALIGIPAGNDFLQLPPVGNSPLGAVKNLPILNDSVEGGLTAGVVVRNNIVDQAGYTGIKVDGETRPFVIEWDGLNDWYANGNTLLQDRGDILVPDGAIMAIDAGGTRVVFEFEDISGAPTNQGGSGQVGGDGFVDGHVPIYYRLGSGSTTYNPSGPDPIRNFGYSAHELLMAMYESIQGSILVTNGLVELVRPTLGPSLTSPISPILRTIGEDPVGATYGGDVLDFDNPALYLEGVTGVYMSMNFQKDIEDSNLNLGLDSFFSYTSFDPVTGETFNGPSPLMPIYEAPQPLAKLINNTVRGSDGTEGAFLADGSLSGAVGSATEESNDVIAEAVDTKLEVSHRGAYFADGSIGDHVGPLPSGQDVDFFKVELGVGDRLIVDLDTVAGGPTGYLRLFGPGGEELATGEMGALPEYLNPGSSVEFPVTDDANARDSYIDYTALAKGTYYVGVSSEGNETYDAKSLADRTDPTGGEGDYSIAIETYAPRSFVLSLDSHPLTPFDAERTTGNINGTLAEGGPGNGAPTLVGTTFTITQIPDYLIPTRTGDAYANVNADGNRVTFEFTSGVNSIVLPNGNINVPILTTDFMNGGGYRVPDIMRAISNAINGYLNNPALPNHEVNNGPDGTNGPISRVEARALGGTQTDNVGIYNFIREKGSPLGGIVTTDGGDPPTLTGYLTGFDFTTGFGHDRRESGGNVSIVPDGTFTDGRGTTELYVAIMNAANVELSPEARAAGLKLGPDNSTLANGDQRSTEYASEADQVLVENGIFVGSGASAAILNNVITNAHQSIVQEESGAFGFGARIDELNPDLSVKKGEITQTGNAIQYDESRNTQLRSDLSWSINDGVGLINRNPALDTSISTDLRTGPSNISGGNSDFNFVARPASETGQTPGNFITLTSGDLFVDAAAGNFTPADHAPIVDSAVDSIDPNVALTEIYDLLGIPSSLIVSPARDHSGQLRADEPTMSPPGGIGANVFKDRGALDTADFVGPIASLENPLDNDFAQLDSDPSNSFVRRTDGVFNEFRVLVQDLGDNSNPFVGSGIDDSTVMVAEIPGLRPIGANVTLFENDRLLTEGIDYTFSYDETRGVITLRPLAGIWSNDHSYRIALNNRDRTVVIAPGINEAVDGDQVAITEVGGGRVIFEYDTGYQILAPEVLTLTVPVEGTNAGGLSDGDVFQVSDGVRGPILFELDNDGITLTGTTPISIPTTPTPIDPDDLQVFLEGIATSIGDALQAEVDGGRIDADIMVDGTKILIGTEAGATVDASNSGLSQAARTLSMQIPGSGVGASGIQDGDTFVLSNGLRTETFEFDTDGNLTARTNIPVIVSNGMTADAAANAVVTAVNDSLLALSSTSSGDKVFFNLPSEGSASVVSGRATIIGISRTPVDADSITVTSVDGSTSATLEINRSDEVDLDGNPADDGVTDPNIPLNITRLTTANELAQQIATALRGLDIGGLDPNVIEASDGGIVHVGGSDGLGLTETGSAIDVVGSPSVAGSSTIAIMGPLLLRLPGVGGAGIADGSTFIVRDDNGNDVVFEMNVAGTPATVAGATVIDFNTFDDFNTLGDKMVAAINAAGTGVTVVNNGAGELSFGYVTDNRLDVSGIPQMQKVRGSVSDGEQVTITQGGVSVTYEFDSILGGGGVGAGNVAVRFLPDSPAGDIATALAAAINENPLGLTISAVAETDSAGNPTGSVKLNDIPGTVVDVSLSPTLSVSGVPGGAIAVPILPSFTAVQIKQALIAAINSDQNPTSLVAEDRGGNTFFVENSQLIDGNLDSFYLPAIKDLAGNPLEPNRDDNTTQFTILLPTIGLDFGDAPDPRDNVPGRLPTRLGNDGARHVVTPDLTLGTRVDAEPDALPTPQADGDDLVINIASSGALFTTSIADGFAQIDQVVGVDATTRDGDTITIALGGETVTLEFDIDGIFAEEHFAIQPVDPTDPVSISSAIADAIAESPLGPSEVSIDGGTVKVFSNDEDGVSFVSDINPVGSLNKGVITPVTVTVVGEGVLEAWIDFNADGDWNDPGERIIDGSNPLARFSDTGAPVTRTFNITVPGIAATRPTPVETYARFRVSREGGLDASGLALSGEVEDYVVTIVPGAPPTVDEANSMLEYTVAEDFNLQALDQDGNLTMSPNDNGILAGITDPDGDPVKVFDGDVGTRTLTTPGGTVVGTLNLQSDGTFSFVPTADFNGVATFTARVSDSKPGAPETEIVSSTPITVTIDVTPVNDPPVASPAPTPVELTIDEDEVITLTTAELIDPFYVPGPANEMDQSLILQEVFSNAGQFVTELGGTLTLSEDGTEVVYTPPADFNSTTQVDRFSYRVADIPGDGQTSLIAGEIGTVEFTINAVNDAPRAGDDFVQTGENEPVEISVATLLSNDTPGPQDEIDAGQTISLMAAQFPLTTREGGTVTQSGDTLTYTPPTGFSGADQFTYGLIDSLNATGQGLVRINVDDVNGAPVFVGVDGNPDQTSLTYTESKDDPKTVTLELSTWFDDPENDPLQYTVDTSNGSIVGVELDGSTMTLTLPPYSFGEADLTITATDDDGLFDTAVVPVIVTNTPDAPEVLNPLGTVNGNENTTVEVDLSDVFRDRDNDDLDYLITQIGGSAVVAGQPFPENALVENITFSGETMFIQLKPNATGSIDIDLRAFDGVFPVTDSFTLEIAAVEEDPIAVADGYVVPVRGTLAVTSVSSGLLRNDSDNDGDTFTVDVATVTSPAHGELTVNADGTFQYVNNSGEAGDTDSFTYRIEDSTGRFSDPVTVTITLSRSRYQNPIAEMSTDVTADGFVTALDALRVINMLNRAGGVNEIPTGELGYDPPDYVDVDGDGVISAFDALLVINELNRRGAEPEGESPAAGVTTSYASVTPNLATRNVAASIVSDEAPATTISGDAASDAVLAGFEGVDSAPLADAADGLATSNADAGSVDSDNIDQALSTIMDEPLL
ncbi:Thermophilic serine proteinase precursor [Crateriforma conspicua]|uniref:Thermophilic serine proteinase n=2 Tax=Crateriforma conspicua TaxID=2527996 RepID=A0A5C6FZH3_9PLAN|nr:Thermophilic serine proteinase precursor [Crateriforma conspicua]